MRCLDEQIYFLDLKIGRERPRDFQMAASKFLLLAA